MLKNLFLAAMLIFPSISMACADHAGHNPAAASAGYAKVDVISAPKKDNDMVKIRLSEAANGKPISMSELKLVHTKQLHLMLIDPTLEDYKHIHPVETKTKGVYEFKLSPAKFGYYRAFADITPTATNKQEYVPFVIGKENRMMPQIDKTPVLAGAANGLQFNLEFDVEPTAGQASMGKITVTKDGEAFKKLEPVMGAYAHIAAFSNNGRKVLHIHPMGEEPKSDKDRGGSELEFHITPQEPGFVKIFAQVKVGGKDLYIPFGIEVK